MTSFRNKKLFLRFQSNQTLAYPSYISRRGPLLTKHTITSQTEETRVHDDIH